MQRFLVLAYGFYRTRIIKKYFSILAFFFIFFNPWLFLCEIWSF